MGTENLPPAPLDIPARLESFSLKIKMDATLTINGSDQWLKPGTEGGMTWKGYEWDGQWVDPIPTPEQLKTAFELIQTGILAPVLEELIEVSTRKIVEARRGA